MRSSVNTSEWYRSSRHRGIFTQNIGTKMPSVWRGWETCALRRPTRLPAESCAFIRISRELTMEPVRAFLIDSNKLFREGLKRLLDDSPFQIVAEAGNLREAVSTVEGGMRPQLILLDL